MGWLEMELWGRQPQRSPKGPSRVLSLRPSSGQLPVRLFLDETVPIHAFLAQAAERGLGNFGELCWGPAKAGEVERSFWLCCRQAGACCGAPHAL